MSDERKTKRDVHFEEQEQEEEENVEVSGEEG